MSTTTTVDRFDKSRDQYISYNLYLERRQGNGYYNLGYKYYIEIQSLTIPYTAGNLATHFTPAYRNFEIALLFNFKVDSDVKLPISSGISPESWLLDKFNSLKKVAFPIIDGITEFVVLPPNEILPALNFVNLPCSFHV